MKREAVIETLVPVIHDYFVNMAEKSNASLFTIEEDQLIHDLRDQFDAACPEWEDHVHVMELFGHTLH
jgi:hypothetical protein